jgi:hypothetical protein
LCKFVNLCITDADVLSVVLRQLLLQNHQEATTTPPEPSDQAQQPEATNELAQDTSSQDSGIPLRKFWDTNVNEEKTYFWFSGKELKSENGLKNSLSLMRH